MKTFMFTHLLCVPQPPAVAAQRLADKLRAPEATVSFIGLLDRAWVHRST
jgi:hypothetical protein